MPNAIYLENKAGLEYEGIPYTTTSVDGYEPPSELTLYEAAWTLDDRPRKMALLVLDMQESYRTLVGNAVPNCKRVLEAFRAEGLPVFWTNWAKAVVQGGGGSDRFFGYRGIVSDTNPNPKYVNPQYEYGVVVDEASTMSELAPQTPLEEGRDIKSLHFSKFADKHADGSDILAPMLEDLGIDTVVVVGSWSEVCVLSTVVEGVERYGFDMVVVSDALSTAMMGHHASLFIQKQSYARLVTTSELTTFVASAELPIPTPGSPSSAIPPVVPFVDGKPLRGVDIGPLHFGRAAREPPRTSGISITAATLLALACSLASGALGAAIARKQAARESTMPGTLLCL